MEILTKPIVFLYIQTSSH